MPRSVSRHDAQTVTTFTFEPVNQTPRFLVSEFGFFTTAIAEHGPVLVLKIARHKKESKRKLAPSGGAVARPSGRAYEISDLKFEIS